MKPLNDFVFLSYDVKKEQKNSKIVLSDVSKDKPSVATVTAIGKDVSQVKVGDEVVFNPFLPREVKIKGQTNYVLKEKDIWAVL